MIDSMSIKELINTWQYNIQVNGILNLWLKGPYILDYRQLRPLMLHMGDLLKC